MPKKKQYKLSAQVTISLWTVVEATSKAEAVRIAAELPLCTIHEDRLQLEPDEGPIDEWRTSGELDGEPREIRVDD